MDFPKNITKGSVVTLSGNYVATPKNPAFRVNKPDVTLIGIGNPQFTGFWFDLEGAENLTLIGLNFRDVGQFFAPNVKNLVMRHCTFSDLKPDNDKFIRLFPGNDGWSFHRVLVEHCGQAWSADFDASGNAARNIKITECVAQFCGLDEPLHGVRPHPHADGHGFGFQIPPRKMPADFGVIIQGCATTNTGEAFCLYMRKDQPASPCTMTDNVADGVFKKRNTMGDAFVVSSSHDGGMPQPGWRNGFVIDRNLAKNCERGAVRVDCMRDRLQAIGNRHVNCKSTPYHFRNPWGEVDMTLIRDNREAA